MVRSFDMFYRVFGEFDGWIEDRELHKNPNWNKDALDRNRKNQLIHELEKEENFEKWKFDFRLYQFALKLFEIRERCPV